MNYKYKIAFPRIHSMDENVVNITLPCTKIQSVCGNVAKFLSMDIQSTYVTWGKNASTDS